MFVFISSTVVMLVALHLIVKPFGIWAGATIVLPHILINTLDFFVDGNLTTVRQIFYSLWGFMLLVAYFKTIKKMHL